MRRAAGRTRLLACVALTSGCATRLVGRPEVAWPTTSAEDGGITLRWDLDPYEVRGRTVQGVRRVLDRRSTYRDARGDTWDGGTTWEFSWSWSYAADDGCRIDGPRVAARISVVVPVLRAATRRDDDAVRDFARYAGSLFEHERGHVERAEQAARDLAAALAALPSFPDCAAAEGAAHAVGDAALARLARDQDAYDQLTDHGATQGATFP